VNAAADGRLPAQGGRLDLLQDFRPAAEVLERTGLTMAEQLAGSYGAIAVCPSKNKMQTLGWVAEALSHLEPDGVLLLAAANSYGAKSYEKLLAMAGSVGSTSKAKCRIMRLRPTSGSDHAVVDGWRQAAEPRRQVESGLWSAPGLFSWEHPDTGSALLLKQLPEKLSGSGMDLCCGYAFLAVNLLQAHPGISRLHLLDADRLALAMAGRNCEEFGEKVTPHWRDAAREALPKGLDWIVCNPPFHAGQERDVELGQMIVANACNSLRLGGTLYLVANRKLPYETVLNERLREVRVLTQQQGYKVLEGVK
ncbi:MAG TPA: methyltransferase, partial [Mariprofundaceae bacterium]|nr:methyltransferase [Mariprofundaceae bacterium]